MVREDMQIDYDFEVAAELQLDLYEIAEEEKQVILHFTLHATPEEDAVRIWKTTYLMDAVTGKKYPLLFAEGISIAPDWTPILPHCPKKFTLLFKGLPKSVRLFHLVELIKEPGGFYVGNIERNTSDIYYIEM